MINATTDDLNVEDGDLYRRWLPYGGEPQTLNDLELIEADGNKAVQFRYNSGGESILVKKFTEKLPSKYQYLRFKIETQAEKLRVWAYTASANKATALYPFRDLNYDEEGYYYLPISATGANIGDLTGIGISISANKVKGIRCALCFNEKVAMMTRLHNNSNVLALPGAYVTKEETYKIVEAFLTTEFEGGRHSRRLDIISDYDNKR